MKGHALLAFGSALVVASACGGATTSPELSSSSGSAGASSSGSSGASSSSGSAAGSSGASACTALGCGQSGVEIDFSYKQAGTYVFEVTTDDTKATCKATLPLPRQPPTACDRPNVLLTLVGSMLPPDQQSIGGLRILTDSATRVTIRGTRDGTVLGEKTFAPEYVVTPGPNGPGCEPAECRYARKVPFP